jgi:hypothetical protein
MIEESLNQIVERWKKAFSQYEELKAASKPAIVRWEWADFERYSLLPFYFQRYPGRGRALKSDPTSVGYYYRYGFDEQDRVHMFRFYDYFHDRQGQARIQQDRIRNFEREDLAETFFSYSDTLAEIIEFSVPPRIPLIAQQIFYEDERVIRHISFRLNGYSPLYSEMGKDPDVLYEWLGANGRTKLFEQYFYADNRLTHMLIYSEHPGSPPLNTFKAEETFSYDEAGSSSLSSGSMKAASANCCTANARKARHLNPFGKLPLRNWWQPLWKGCGLKISTRSCAASNCPIDQFLITSHRSSSWVSMKTVKSRSHRKSLLTSTVYSPRRSWGQSAI